MKNNLIRRLVSKHMTSLSGQQTIIMPNISRKEDDQAMKFGQLIEYTARKIFFFKNHAENEAGRPAPDVFLVFKSFIYEVKAIGLQLSFIIFCQPLTWHAIERNCIKLQAIDPEICSILIFQRITSSPHFVHDFSRKMFLM